MEPKKHTTQTEILETHQFVHPSPSEKDQEIMNTVQRLDPWFYPVTIQGVQVAPGVNSLHEPAELTIRTNYRRELLLDAAVSRFDFTGKSLLDLGANISYWAAQFVPYGLSKMVALEGRELFINQSELFWKENPDLQQVDYHTIKGNVLEDPSWTAIQKHGNFDVVFCAGLLYHLPEYLELLEKMASLSPELMIVDTRVVHDEEQLIQQKLDRTFNAIEGVEQKKKPNLSRLMDAISNLGYEPEWIKPEAAWPEGMPPQDDYFNGSRVTIIAKRKA